LCDCGVEGSHERVWSDDHVERARFRELARHAVDSLTEKGVTLRRKTAFGFALQARDDGASVDEAISRGVAAGIAAAAGSDGARAAGGDTRRRAD
jgi:hypothetical protein